MIFSFIKTIEMKALILFLVLLISQLVLSKYLLVKLDRNQLESDGNKKPKEIQNDSEETLNSMPKSIQLTYETDMNHKKPSWKPQKPKPKKPKADQQRYDMPQVLNP